MRTLPICCLAAIGLLFGCMAAAPPPGYNGPVISPAAQTLIGVVEGAKYKDESGALGGGEWTIGTFAVIPNPISKNGKGPVLLLTQGTERRYVPMELDGDAVDFYRRIKGKTPPGFEATQSEAYQALWKKR